MLAGLSPSKLRGSSSSSKPASGISLKSSEGRPVTGLVVKLSLPQALMPYRWKEKPTFNTMLEENHTLPVRCRKSTMRFARVAPVLHRIKNSRIR
jgi:hypothetical protein